MNLERLVTRQELRYAFARCYSLLNIPQKRALPCLSSNVATGSVPTVAAHNARALLAAGHPISLCTDDKALFDTTSSQEHWLAATNFGLSRRQVFELSRAASLQAFAEPEVAERLARIFQEAEAEML